MGTIWKFKLSITDVQNIDLPMGAMPLAVAEQNGELCMWVDIPDTTVATRHRTFFVVGTGNPKPAAAAQHIGTVVMDPFALVWHVFE